MVAETLAMCGIYWGRVSEFRQVQNLNPDDATLFTEDYDEAVVGFLSLGMLRSRKRIHRLPPLSS